MRITQPEVVAATSSPLSVKLREMGAPTPADASGVIWVQARRHISLPLAVHAMNSEGFAANTQVRRGLLGGPTRAIRMPAGIRSGYATRSSGPLVQSVSPFEYSNAT